MAPSPIPASTTRRAGGSLKLGLTGGSSSDTLDPPKGLTYLDTARAHAGEALSLASEYKAPYYRAWAAILAGYALAWQRPDEDHLARLRAAIAALTATGARLRLPYYLALLAGVYGKAGRAASPNFSRDSAA